MKIKYLKPLQEEADVVREDGKHVDHIEGSLQEGHLALQSKLSNKFEENFVKENLFWGTG